MDWAVAMAKLFRERDNKPILQPQIGEVISISPLRIALLSDAAILDAGQIYLCAALAEGQERKADFSLPAGQFQFPGASGTGSAEGEATVTFKEVLRVGDLVACVPTAQTPKFIVVDRVVTA